MDINFKNCIELNKQTLLAEASTFGISWLSDGTTIARMPLINTLAMCGDVAPTCVAITYCSEHMAGGGKKDAPFIAGLQEGIVSEYDPTKTFTDIFFFDGAANVAKAGKVLEAKYPRLYVLHGGEHIISLFFDDLSKHPAVKVSRHRCCCS